MFLIWATHGVDTEVLNEEYFNAAGEPKTLWEIPDAEHVGGLAARPAEYERRVVGFFDRALLDGYSGWIAFAHQRDQLTRIVDEEVDVVRRRPRASPRSRIGRW